MTRLSIANIHMTIHITNINNPKRYFFPEMQDVVSLIKKAVSIIDDCLDDDLKCEREPIDDFARRTLVTSVMSKAGFSFF